MYDTTFKIILLAAPEVDKRGISERYLTNIFEPDQLLTIGVNFETKNFSVYEKKVKLQIWDFSGENRFRFLLSTYVRGANGAIIIYNINEDTTVSELRKWVNHTKQIFREKVDIDFPVILIGNKSNLAVKKNYFHEIFSMGYILGVDGYVECCINTGVNVETAFILLTALMLEEPIILNSLIKDITRERKREIIKLANLESLYPVIEVKRIPSDRSSGKRIQKYLASALRFMREKFRNRHRLFCFFAFLTLKIVKVNHKFKSQKLKILVAIN